MHRRDFRTETFIEHRMTEILELNAVYLTRYPAAELLTEEMILSPLYENGEDIICAYDSSGQLAGYIPLAAHLSQTGDTTHLVWANIVISPVYQERDELRGLLLEQGQIRVSEMVSSSPGAGVYMWFQHHVSEVETIKYLERYPGVNYMGSVLRMVRDLSGVLEYPSDPEGIEVRLWDVKSDTDIEEYVAARNQALGMPVTVADWRYFLRSVVGSNGTTIGAFDKGKLAGAVSAYWIEEDNRRLGKNTGWTENVFVLEGWRGKGIADAMLSLACSYLKDHGMVEAWLDPGASNQRAVCVYKRCGYRITGESRQYRLKVR